MSIEDEKLHNFYKNAYDASLRMRKEDLEGTIKPVLREQERVRRQIDVEEAFDRSKWPGIETLESLKLTIGRRDN